MYFDNNSMMFVFSNVVDCNMIFWGEIVKFFYFLFIEILEINLFIFIRIDNVLIIFKVGID